MKIREIMTKEPVVCPPMARLEDAAKLMLEANCGAIPIVNDIFERKPIGILTDRDITCRTLGKGLDPMGVYVKDVMTPQPITMGAELPIEECVEEMERNGIRRVLVVDPDGSCVGIVAQADIARNAPAFETADLLKQISGPRVAAVAA